MKTVLREVSLLLDQFQKSEWRDLHIRTDRYSLFIAKANGGANPMLAAAADQLAAPFVANEAATMVVAPHLGTLSSIVAVGSEVHEGSVIAQLEVLGAHEDVVSRTAGVVEEVLVMAGTLVEFETPLLRIV